MTEEEKLQQLDKKTLFLKMADTVYSHTYMGIMDIEKGVGLLRDILESRNSDKELEKLK